MKNKEEEPFIPLTIELVPQTSWCKNVRSVITPKEWDNIRREVYKNANYRCEICSGAGKKWPVECHEVWLYDDKTHTQELAGFKALCPACHQVKHLGLTMNKGKGMEATYHLSRVNFWSFQMSVLYIHEAFAKWNERNEYEWSINLSVLDVLQKKQLGEVEQ